MRRLVRAAVLALLALLGGVPARAIDCGSVGAPGNFTAQYETTYQGQPVPNVHLSWSPPTIPDQYVRFVGYRVYRLDQTAGDAVYTQISNDVLLRYESTTDYWNWAGDPFEDAVCDQHPCARPGRTYFYRVVSLWNYTTSACDGYEAGAVFETSSAPVQVTIPGPPPPPPAIPTNVRAVAEAKKPRVVVTWAPPEGAVVDRYVVERRGASGAASPQAKPGRFLDLGVWAVVARLRAPDPRRPVDTVKFLDRSVDPTTFYEYRVAAEIDGVVGAVSLEDGACTPGSCGRSRWQVWNGDWKFDGSDRVVSFYEYEGELKGVVDDWLCDQDGCRRAGNEYAQFFVAPRSTSRTKATFPSRVVSARDLLTVGGAELPLNTPGTVTMEVKPADPFSPDAYRRGTARLRFGKFVQTFDVARTADTLGATQVCGVIAAPAKDFVTRPGGRVAFVFRAVALGPQPLYADQIQVHLTVEGGTFDGAEAGLRARLANDPAGQRVAVFDVGALGPASSSKSEEAFLVAVCTADAAPPKGQMRVTAQFVRLAGGAAVAFVEEPPYAEVRVDAPKPAAKER